MAKKNTNVAEQLKKFNANIADEEIVEKTVEEKPKHSIKDYSPNVKKKELLITEVPNIQQISHEKISKQDLIQLVQRLQTIQGGLKQEIIQGIEQDLDVRNKLSQIVTPDLRLINEILINL